MGSLPLAFRGARPAIPTTPGATRTPRASPPVVAHGHRDVLRAERALGAPVWPFSGAPCAMGCKSPHGGSAWPRRRRRARPGVRERGVEGALSECTRQLRKSSGPPMLGKVLGLAGADVRAAGRPGAASDATACLVPSLQSTAGAVLNAVTGSGRGGEPGKLGGEPPCGGSCDP